MLETMKTPTRTPTTMPIVVFVCAAASLFHMYNAGAGLIWAKTCGIGSGAGVARAGRWAMGTCERDTIGMNI